MLFLLTAAQAQIQLELDLRKAKQEIERLKEQLQLKVSDELQEEVGYLLVSISRYVGRRCSKIEPKVLTNSTFLNFFTMFGIVI